MDFKLNHNLLPMPKETHFQTAIGMLLKTNHSKHIMKTEIFQKIRIRMKDIILPIIIKDFQSTTKVTVKDGTISPIDLDKIKTFLDNAKNINITKFFNEILNEAFKKEAVRNACEATIDKVKESIKTWFNNYLKMFDEKLKQAVEGAMKRCHSSKCSMKQSLYNFTDTNVTQKVLNLIENGIKSVPTVSRDGTWAVKQAMKETLENLINFRRIIHRRPYIYHSDVKKWLKAAIEDSINDCIDDQEYIAYYKHVQDNLCKAMKIIRWNCDQTRSEIDINVLSKDVDIQGAVFSLADKNFGVVLLPLKVALSAEQQMLEELKAEKLDCEASDVIETVEQKIKMFEKSLNFLEREHLDSFGNNRCTRPSTVKLPYLKLNPKVHKLKENEILNKDSSKLKFRPVQDSSEWIMKPYAQLLMFILRDLLGALRRKFPSISQIESLTGEKVSQRMRNLNFPSENFKFFVSADMSSAYSNIFKEDVLSAITTATELLGVNDWRRDLALKLSELVLGSNFVECATGIYQLSECLPMGSSASQDCLNIVSVVHELRFYTGVTCENEVKITIDKNFKVEVEINKNTTEVMNLSENEAENLKLFMRYIDDTQGVFSGQNLENALNLICKILKIYPKQLTVNATLNVMCFSHLDCIGFVGFCENTINTLVRRNFIAPINLVPQKSNCPTSNKYSIILSESLRYRRICSDTKFVSLNEDFLFGELLHAGYTKRDLRNQFEKSRQHIKVNYDQDTFEKKVVNEENEYQNCCGKFTYDQLSGSHKVLKTLLSGGSHLRVRNILVPSYKIKTYLVSKRKHLKRLRNFINNKKIE